MSIPLADANRIIDAALARARELGLPPVGVAVLDAGGHLVALQREDGLSFLRVGVCQAKAFGALGMGASSRHIAERAEGGARERGFLVALDAMTGGRVVPLPGGVLARDAGDGRVVGAVGVSGAASQDDEACAIAGLEAAGLAADLESTR